MSWQRKLKIVFLLGAGGVATATTIFRLYKLVRFQDSEDVASDFVLLDLLTIIEVTIGVICACLPAANILFEHHFGNHSSAHAGNSPRSGKHERNSRLVWRGLGTPMPQRSKSSSTGTAPTRATDEETLATSDAIKHMEIPSSFDVELAMLARRSNGHHPWSSNYNGEMTTTKSKATPMSQTPELQSDSEHWFVLERATSRDGRREGWLSSATRPSQAHQGTSTTSRNIGTRGEEVEESEESRTSEMISMELAKVSGNRPWTRIWDGRTNT